ncbi:hypothetical protein Rumeso_01629 [Rubellimicrobium mesophilum DSM 19309]|uniref:Uncharacterized protein n=1 Tax=Rubellimicrobium mesophilum DSM 19309 TaxID=442562 RepID=A0A017HQL6_9RHOB|nr:hypothetical protein Rumeso_01629 [Rubellimicrobium mesophilum DSM 19309]
MKRHFLPLPLRAATRADGTELPATAVRTHVRHEFLPSRSRNFS